MRIQWSWRFWRSVTSRASRPKRWLMQPTASHLLRGEQPVGHPHPDDEDPVFFGRGCTSRTSGSGPTIGGEIKPTRCRAWGGDDPVVDLAIVLSSLTCSL
jgi:hypothetical protein